MLIHIDNIMYTLYDLLVCTCTMQRSPFSIEILSMIRTLVMTTGELDYDEIFHLNPAGERENVPELAFLPVAYILWIPFVIVMPLLFVNLLVYTCN